MKALQMSKTQGYSTPTPGLQDYELHDILQRELQLEEEEDNIGNISGNEDDDDFSSTLIISYYSRTQLKFDFLTCILVIYDCFMAPYKNSFGSDIMEG